MVRRYLAIIRKRKLLFGVICIFYIKTNINVARITVKSVLLKATKTEKHKKKDKDDHVVAQSADVVKEVKMIEGYWILCENLKKTENRFEEVVK